MSAGVGRGRGRKVASSVTELHACVRSSLLYHTNIQHATRLQQQQQGDRGLPGKKKQYSSKSFKLIFCFAFAFCVSNRQVCINNCIVIDSIPQQSYHSNSKFTSVERTPAGPLSDTVLVTYRTVCRTMQ
jgi:hypothetical protein